MMIAASVAAFGLVITTITINSYFSGPPKSCKLTEVSRRDFKQYYGLVNIENPLSYYNAEDIKSMDSKCHLYYDHMDILPASNSPLSTSMIIQALRGAGKTHIRQCIIARLSTHNYIVIKLYGMNLNNYLNAFVHSYDVPVQHPKEKIQKYWTKEHFLQIILIEIATTFVDEKYLSLIKKKRNTIRLDIREEMAVLLTFYYTKHSDVLCKMINLLLPEFTECYIWSCSIPCNENKMNTIDSFIYDSVTAKYNKIKVRNQNPSATDPSRKLLLSMYTKTRYSPLPFLDRSYREQIALLLGFLTKLEISTTVIVDSLDESNLFFDNADPTLRTLQVFVDSVTNDDVLHLALGNWGDSGALSNSFSFLILIPKTETIPMNISWTRRDKIPIIDVNWNTFQLINYADYVFDYLRSKSHHRCKELPTICSLLGGQELCIDTIKKLRHPRDFHIFFDNLIQHMKTVCTQRDPPFIATVEDLKYVSERSQSQMLNETAVWGDSVKV